MIIPLLLCVFLNLSFHICGGDWQMGLTIAIGVILISTIFNKINNS